MADARRRRFDCVLVWKYDRFARSLGALVAALQEFRDLGVDFISHTQAIDTTTPMGRLFFHVPGGIKYGQHWLNVKFDKSLIRVPFRILTAEEEKLLSKNYKDISKQVEEAFKRKK